MSDESDKYQFIADSLAESGWVVVPNFLSDELSRALQAEARQLCSAAEFRPAGVGKGESWKLVPEIRDDKVHWLNEPFSATQAAYLAELEQLRQAINQTLFLGLWDYEGHYALYGPGSHYSRHVDQFANTSQRTVTAIVYLNDDWQLEDGGQLRIYLNGEEAEPFEDVLPERGTLACFLSAGFYHEVLPAGRERLSVTGWFRTRE